MTDLDPRAAERDTDADRPSQVVAPLPSGRIGLVAGLVGIMCCVGPTVLALVGLISGATAFSLATDLYDGWAWAFRLAGLAVAAGLVWWSLRRRNACSLGGVARARTGLVKIVAVGVMTYGGLYALTTWLGTFA
jgi:hypothetical protein